MGRLLLRGWELRLCGWGLVELLGLQRGLHGLVGELLWLEMGLHGLVGLEGGLDGGEMLSLVRQRPDDWSWQSWG